MNCSTPGLPVHHQLTELNLVCWGVGQLRGIWGLFLGVQCFQIIVVMAAEVCESAKNQ